MADQPTDQIKYDLQELCGCLSYLNRSGVLEQSPQLLVKDPCNAMAGASSTVMREKFATICASFKFESREVDQFPIALRATDQSGSISGSEPDPTLEVAVIRALSAAGVLATITRAVELIGQLGALDGVATPPQNPPGWETIATVKEEILEGGENFLRLKPSQGLSLTLSEVVRELRKHRVAPQDGQPTFGNQSHAETAELFLLRGLVVFKLGFLEANASLAFAGDVGGAFFAPLGVAKMIDGVPKKYQKIIWEALSKDLWDGVQWATQQEWGQLSHRTIRPSSALTDGGHPSPVWWR